jgi:hypothetical protein
VGVQKRKPVAASREKPVKTTLSLDVDLHARLCAKAAKRRMGVSALVVEFIRAGLRGFVVIDRGESSDPGDNEDRTSRRVVISPDAGDEAA